MGKKATVISHKAKQETKKRKIEEEEDFESSEEMDADDDCEGNDMTNFLQKFTADLKKKTTAKKKKIAGLAASSSENTKAKLDNILDGQCRVRETLTKEYKKQFDAVLAQWETDIAKAKEAEEKINETLQQQQKLFAQVRLIQVQRLKATKNLYTQYLESVEEAEKNVKKQQDDLATELKKEMEGLQKKILADTQAQDMANMKKVLRTVMQ